MGKLLSVINPVSANRRLLRNAGVLLIVEAKKELDGIEMVRISDSYDK